MEAQPGDLIHILKDTHGFHILKDTHGYPINWVFGMNIVRFYNGSMGILVEISSPIANESRTFYKVATPQGLVSIFSGYTRIIK